MTRRLFAPLAAALLLLATLNTAHAMKPKGWFYGAGISMFELSGSGNVSTSNGSVDFDMQSRNAYGLITNENVVFSDDGFGFGWENSQLPGARFGIGYRHNDQFVTHMDFFWALPKSQELSGYPDPTEDDLHEYLFKQETNWRQSSFRLMIDWTPFEPLPLWFFSAGVEYTRFNSRINVIWEGVDNQLPQYRRFEDYQDSGSALGGVVGTGLQFASEDNPRLEWYVQLQYAFVPYNDTFYAWDSEILLGGVALEAGMRVFRGDQE